MSRLARTFVFCLLATSARTRAAAADDTSAAEQAPLASVQSLRIPEATQVRLENGLTVVLEESHGAPVVSMELRYATGTRDDPPGREGLAVLTQRMTMMGTRHVPAGTYEAWLDRIGASDRGSFTSADAISEWATVPSDAIPIMLWLWSDQMGFFAPSDPAILDDARALTRNQWREKIDDAAYGGVRDLVFRGLYPSGRPYHGFPAGGAIDGATLDDVRAFHDRHFAPNAAALVLVGDFRSAEVLDRIRTYFGPVPQVSLDRPVPSPARLEHQARVEVAASVQAPVVLLNWRTPALYAAGDAEMDVLAGALAGSRIAELHWALIDRARIATAVTAHQSSRALGSDFQIRAVVAPGHTPEEVIVEIDRVLALIRARNLKEEGLRASIANVLRPRVHELNRPARRAGLYAGYALARHDARWLANDLARYEALTSDDLRLAIAAWLMPDRRVVTVVTPDANAPPGGVLRAMRGGK